MTAYERNEHEENKAHRRQCPTCFSFLRLRTFESHDQASCLQRQLKLKITDGKFHCGVCGVPEDYRLDMLEHYKWHGFEQLKANGMHASRVEHNIFALRAQQARKAETNHAARDERRASLRVRNKVDYSQYAQGPQMEYEVDIIDVDAQVQSTEGSAPIRPEAKQLQFKFSEGNQLELVFNVNNAKKVAAADKKVRNRYEKQRAKH